MRPKTTAGFVAKSNRTFRKNERRKSERSGSIDTRFQVGKAFQVI